LIPAALHIIQQYIQKAVAVFHKGNAAFFYLTKSPLFLTVSVLSQIVLHFIPAYFLSFCRFPLPYNIRAPPRPFFEKNKERSAEQ